MLDFILRLLWGLSFTITESPACFSARKAGANLINLTVEINPKHHDLSC